MSKKRGGKSGVSRSSKRRVSTISRTKAITTRKGERVLAKQTIKRFKRSVQIKKGSDSREQFDRHVKPEFEKFVRRKLRRGEGNRFILRIDTTHSGKGFRRRSFFSGSRVKITGSGRKLAETLRRVKEKFAKSFEKYLRRKGMTSISISGVHLEVIKKSTTKTRSASRGVSSQKIRTRRK